MQSKFKVFNKIYFPVLSYNFFFLNDANGQIDNIFVCIERGTKDLFFWWDVHIILYLVPRNKENNNYHMWCCGLDVRWYACTCYNMEATQVSVKFVPWLCKYQTHFEMLTIATYVIDIRQDLIFYSKYKHIFQCFGNSKFILFCQNERFYCLTNILYVEIVWCLLFLSMLKDM